MEKENVLEDLEGESVEELVQEFDESGENDITDYKSKAEMYRGLAARNLNKLTKARKALGERQAESAKKPAETEKKEGFDYGEKAILRARGIAKDEDDFVFKMMKEMGKTDVEDVLDSSYFQAELKGKREAKATQEAIPTGTNRAEGGARDSIDYWLQKPFSEVPPEMKQAVLNAREKKEGGGSVFTDRPVV